MSTSRYRRLAAFLLAAILAATLMPGSAKSAMLSFPGHVSFEKIGHALGFLSMAFCLVRSRYPWLGRMRVVAFAVFLGCGTELLQQFVPGRTSLLSDVVIDVTGALVGTLAARAPRA